MIDFIICHKVGSKDKNQWYKKKIRLPALPRNGDRISIVTLDATAIFTVELVRFTEDNEIMFIETHPDYRYNKNQEVFIKTCQKMLDLGFEEDGAPGWKIKSSTI